MLDEPINNELTPLFYQSSMIHLLRISGTRKSRRSFSKLILIVGLIVLVCGVLLFLGMRRTGYFWTFPSWIAKPSENVSNEKSSAVPERLEPVLNRTICSGTDILMNCESYCDNTGCKIWDLHSIPHIWNHVSTKFTSWVDGKEAVRCLSNLTVVFFGDSTMRETVVDIGGLLLGVRADSRQYREYSSFIAPRPASNKSTHFRIERKFQFGGANSDVIVSLINNYLNISINAASRGIWLRYRYTGHHKLEGNSLGIKTFFEKSFSEELACMIGADASSKTVCPRPDVIVINTGLHDHSGHHNISEFKWRLKAVLGRLQTVYRKSHGHHATIILKSMFLYHQNPIVNELRLCHSRGSLIFLSSAFPMRSATCHSFL